VGIVPLVFVNDDLPELTPFIEPEDLVAEIARLGYLGTQLSRGLPQGDALGTSLRSSGLRIAEVYAALPCGVDGPPPAARDQVLEAIDTLERVEGDVLVFSYHLSDDRVGHAARAEQPTTPRLTHDGWRRAIELINEAASLVVDHGGQLVYHPHIGTFIETPEEVDRVVGETDPATVGLCLDVGHYLAGGGDPTAAIHSYGSRLRHVHMKDVDPEVLTQLRAGRIGGFLDALRHQLFVELGEGALDLPGTVAALADIGYAGWLMVEQDTTRRNPAESAAIGRSVLLSALASEDFRRRAAESAQHPT
jgi:inosose dehydratase